MSACNKCNNRCKLLRASSPHTAIVAVVWKLCLTKFLAKRFYRWKKKPTVFRVQLIDTQLNSRLTFMDCGFCVYVCTFRQLNRLPTPGKLLLPTAVISGWGTLQIGGVCHSVCQLTNPGRITPTHAEVRARRNLVSRWWTKDGGNDKPYTKSVIIPICDCWLDYL